MDFDCRWSLDVHRLAGIIFDNIPLENSWFIQFTTDFGIGLATLVSGKIYLFIYFFEAKKKRGIGVSLAFILKCETFFMCTSRRRNNDALYEKRGSQILGHNAVISSSETTKWDRANQNESHDENFSQKLQWEMEN